MLIARFDHALLDDSRQRQDVIVGGLPKQQAMMESGEA
jgi:hypothetical protein